MKKTYTGFKINIIFFNNSDVITTSEEQASNILDLYTGTDVDVDFGFFGNE